ncbi:RnfABCDGE type electron transport complex subunit D [Candidatus Gottesmanbacteria bacterium]|nr:RnfABCDGE type electron transport complex subunit D [Candidatus Gottesmanbacteria bacterium]
MDLKTFWADSRGKVIAVLCALWVASLINHFQWQFVLSVILAVVSIIIFDSFLLWLKIKNFSISLSSIVTGLLIGLVFDPMAGFIPLVVASLFASVSKNFIGKGPHKHIFNPAAFGILISSMIFGWPVAWWGASWGMIPVVIIAVGMLPILWKLRRQWIPVTFLIIYYFLSRSISLTIDGTVFLFGFVMLPEVKTSPIPGSWWWGWGILVGALIFVQNLLGLAVGDPLLLALLAANLAGYFLVRQS